MIVTTRQKMQVMINRRLKEGTKEYNKIKALKVAFVVDECHRAVTPQTKRDIEKFFNNSIWFGFTGTPIFEENKYEQKGDLPQTTEELYGPFAPTPADVNGLSKKQKKTFIKLFRDLDHDYAHLKSFSTFEPENLDEYGFSQQIYEDYIA